MAARNEGYPKRQCYKTTISSNSIARYLIRDFCFVYHCQTVQQTVAYFEIHEQREHGRLRLQLTGELDLVSASVLEDRLEQLRVEKPSVRLDLSMLEFIDSAGIHLLIRAFNQARADGWQFEVDPELSPQVQHLFQLTDMDRIIGTPVQRSFARQALRT